MTAHDALWRAHDLGFALDDAPFRRMNILHGAQRRHEWPQAEVIERSEVIAGAQPAKASSTVTGAWSLGLGHLRGVRSMLQAVTSGTSGWLTRMWSMRRPRFFW